MPSTLLPSATDDYAAPQGMVLNKAAWDAAMVSIGERLRAREALEASFDELIAEGTGQALAVIQANVGPQLEAAQDLLDGLATQIAVAEDAIAGILGGNLSADNVTESATRVFLTPAQKADLATLRTQYDALVASASASYDTLAEIGTAVAANATAVATKLTTANNLSDVPNAAVARANLGISSSIPVGGVIMSARFEPITDTNWLKADGSKFAVASYPELAAVTPKIPDWFNPQTMPIYNLSSSSSATLVATLAASDTPWAMTPDRTRQIRLHASTALSSSFQSVDSGVTWTAMTGTLPAAPLYLSGNTGVPASPQVAINASGYAYFSGSSTSSALQFIAHGGVASVSLAASATVASLYGMFTLPNGRIMAVRCPTATTTRVDHIDTGTSWTAASAPPWSGTALTRMIQHEDGTVFVVVGNNVYYTQNATSWSGPFSLGAAFSTGITQPATHFNSRFHGGEHTGCYVFGATRIFATTTSTATGFMLSTDSGATWSLVTYAFGSQLRSIIKKPGAQEFYFCFASAIVKTTDFVTFTPVFTAAQAATLIPSLGSVNFFFSVPFRNGTGHHVGLYSTSLSTHVVYKFDNAFANPVVLGTVTSGSATVFMDGRLLEDVGVFQFGFSESSTPGYLSGMTGDEGVFIINATVPPALVNAAVYDTVNKIILSQGASGALGVYRTGFWGFDAAVERRLPFFTASLSPTTTGGLKATMYSLRNGGDITNTADPYFYIRAKP